MAIVCQNWSFVSNHSQDEECRIIVIWKAPMAVVVLHKLKQYVTCTVTWPGFTSFYYTVVYAANHSDERTGMWVELINIQANLLDDSTPWDRG